MDWKKTVNPDLKRERENVSFDPVELSYVLHGGKQKLDRKHYIEHMVAQDPEYDTVPYYFKSIAQRYSDTIKPAIHVLKKFKEHDITDPEDIHNYERNAIDDVNDGSAVILHRIAFRPPILAQGTEEQVKKWIPLIDRFEVIGSYGQTELGHGSNLRAIETTAIYDANTEEFILNTPTLTSMKWWPGNLGKSCNHTLLIAQTYTKGEHVGVLAFIVPIRSMDTHEPLPGVIVGDIGPTYGGTGTDNGYLRLNNVRVPRINMLMKFSQILKDGTYVKPSNPRALYQGMMMIRSAIPYWEAFTLAKGATIVTRYSLVRHQSELKPGASEPQVLDYQTQQHKVFPALAMAYSFWFVGKWVRDQGQLFQEELKRGIFDRMAPLHAAASCLKSYTSEESSKCIEVCRLACGGHGYSMASGFHQLFVGSVAQITAEGEATILHLQAARYLIKAAMDVKSGKKLPSLISYLAENQGSRLSYTGIIDNLALLKACQYHSVRCITKAGERIERLMTKHGAEMYDAFNQSSVLLVEASKAHAEALVMDAFIKKLNSEDVSQDMRKVLEPMAAIFGINKVLNSSAHLLESGWINANQLDSLREKLYIIYEAVRPNAIAYADAFDFPDRLLGSVLGRYDGDVYNQLFKWAQQAPLNKEQVHESFYKYVKPMREEMKAKL